MSATDINDWPGHPDADPDCECCLGDGLQADGETPCPCIDAREGTEAIRMAAAPMWKGPGETPHRYSPDYMAQGDCQVCGHHREAHQSAPDAVARLVEAALRELVAACEAYPVNIPRADAALDDAHAALRALKGGA